MLAASPQQVEVFSDEGCVDAYNCAVAAANECARINEEDGAPTDEPFYTWQSMCIEHEEQPAGICPDCNQA